MRNVLIAASIVAFSASVSAQSLVARSGADSVRLSEQPCPVQIHDKLPAPPDFFKAALVHFRGVHYIACWRLVGISAHLVYEDGDQGLIPMAEFKEDVGV